MSNWRTGESLPRKLPLYWFSEKSYSLFSRKGETETFLSTSVELSQCHGRSKAAPCKNPFKHDFTACKQCSISEWISLLQFNIKLKLCSIETTLLRYAFIFAYIYHYENSVIPPSLTIFHHKRSVGKLLISDQIPGRECRLCGLAVIILQN